MTGPRFALALALAVALAPAPVVAQWSCPKTGAVPASFQGYFTAGDGTVSLGADAVFVATGGDIVPAARCVSHLFANPNKPVQAFITYGNAHNFANDTNTGCALIDLSLQSAVLWSEALDGAPCPLSPSSAGAYGGWSSPAPPPFACPKRPRAQVPPSLRGVGRLPAGSDGDADSRLIVSAAAWSNVTAGSFSSPGCVEAVRYAGAGVTALTLSARADGRAQACFWARAGADRASLDFKAGSGAACPSDFAGAESIPFKFS